MKPIKRITQFFLIILAGAAINIYSSTNDEPMAEPTEPTTSPGAASTQEGRPRKVLSLKDLAMGKVASVYNPQYIINQVNTYLNKQDGLNEAVDYVTGLHLDQKLLIDILHDAAIRWQNDRNDPIPVIFFIKTIISNTQLHDNVAFKHIQTILIGILKYMYFQRFDDPDNELLSQMPLINTIFRIFADVGVSFNNELGADLLYTAAIAKNDSLIKILIESAKLNVDLATPKGNALTAAISVGNLPLVEYLLKHNADPLLHVRALNGTPLSLAKSLVQKARNSSLRLHDHDAYHARINNSNDIYKLVSQAAAQEEAGSSTGQTSSADQGNLRG